MKVGQLRAFTLVELIVVITILAILWTIWFVSFLGYGVTARDTVRVSDINSIIKVVELYKLQEWVYPPVSNPVNVTFSGSTIWQQWSFWEETRQFARRISETPIDPLTLNEYAYSKTNATQEYQVWAIVEKSSSLWFTPDIIQTETYAAAPILSKFATSVTKWNYNGKFITHRENKGTINEQIYVLWVPSILSTDIVDVSLLDIILNGRFVYEWGFNAPSTYADRVDTSRVWEYTPSDVSWDIQVIYSWTLDSFNTWTWKLEFISNVQDYYAGTDVENSSSFQSEFWSLDTVNNPSGAIELANTYIWSWVGGLGDEWFVVSNTSAWSDTGDTNSSVIARNVCGKSFGEANYLYGWEYMWDSYINSNAFLALKDDGSITSWWDPAKWGSWAPAWNNFVEWHQFAIFAG